MEDLKEYYEKLVDIRKYLIKKGQSRYKGNVIENKLGESRQIILECETILKRLEKQLKSNDFILVTRTYDKINSLFQEILNLCNFTDKTTKMDFDIKTACSLLPVMDGSESTTKRLVDGVEMYADMLDDSGKLLLITFVLKSRLSENAKLRLNSNNTSVKELIKDLKHRLFTQKSFTAIQTQLLRTKQGSKSIEEYGSELEKLFTDLTITQAEGDTTKYAFLKPLNEKQAVKQFSDGLRNPRLSTIITARNYANLADAIQAAKEEEMTSSSSINTGEVMQFARSTGYYNHGRGRGGSVSRGQGQGRGRGFRTFYNNNRYNNSHRPDYNSNGYGSFNKPNFNERFQRGNNYRGRFQRPQNIYHVNGNEEEPSQSTGENQSTNNFFRA
ncbi:hypothetical protein JYU34_013065 [Plutella xylostella]|uniref:Retrotransposon gag domain-containing protein n=1 Tax=Plutella xylostella TaxID=51655 RepID=A0ABQ7QCT7_PLUXY|nr:hypothetical protein JYU34_013065 [Plutella xylostella]